jgi:hypothetical protein
MPLVRSCKQSLRYERADHTTIMPTSGAAGIYTDTSGLYEFAHATWHYCQWQGVTQPTPAFDKTVLLCADIPVETMFLRHVPDGRTVSAATLGRPDTVTTTGRSNVYSRVRRGHCTLISAYTANALCRESVQLRTLPRNLVHKHVHAATACSWCSSSRGEKCKGVYYMLNCSKTTCRGYSTQGHCQLAAQALVT